jgi:hypothetical protein
MAAAAAPEDGLAMQTTTSGVGSHSGLASQLSERDLDRMTRLDRAGGEGVTRLLRPGEERGAA